MSGSRLVGEEGRAGTFRRWSDRWGRVGIATVPRVTSSSLRLAFAIRALSNGGGGAERALVLVAGELARRGHAVRVVTFDPVGAAAFYPTAPELDFVRLGIGDVKGSAGIGLSLRRLPALRRALTQHRPDVAVPFMHSMYVPTALALVGTAVPVVAVEQNVAANFDNRAPWHRLARDAVRPLVSAWTIPTETARVTYRRAMRDRLRVLPNPVPPVPVGDPERAPVVLAAGRLEAQKDHATLVSAFARLAPEFPDWRLVIVGDGPLRTALEQQVQDLGLAERVTLEPVRSDLLDLMGRAAVFALPSIYESFGLVTGEALAAGTPVVAFADCPGTSELVAHGRNGILVDGADRVETLASGLRELMGDAGLRATLGRAGPASVARLAVASVADAWEELLREVAAGRST